VNTSKVSKPRRSTAIRQLKAKWSKLSDVDRAHAVADIRNSGVFNRQIARELGRSESGLRHLFKILDASLEDLDLARHNKISTNELIRRGKGTKLRPAVQPSKAAEIRPTISAGEAADLICNWFGEHKIYRPDGEMIIKEVRREFAIRERDGSLQAFSNNAVPPINELVWRCKPKRAFPKDATSIHWYHEWLFRWVYFAFPDAQVRDEALQLALDRQKKR
jgi:hypothetical protein